MPELKPCPFCGYKHCASRQNQDESSGSLAGVYFYAAYCGNCGASHDLHETEEYAIEMWNARTPDPRIAELEKDLEYIKKHQEIIAAGSKLGGIRAHELTGAWQIANKALKGA